MAGTGRRGCVLTAVCQTLLTAALDRCYAAVRKHFLLHFCPNDVLTENVNTEDT